MSLSPFSRFISVLTAVVVLLCIVGFASSDRRDSSHSAVLSWGTLYQDLKTDDIEAIGIITTEGAYRLIREPDGWIMPEKDDFPVRHEAISDLLKDLREAKRVAPRTRLDARLDELGLGDPEEGRSGAKLGFSDERTVVFGVKAGRQYGRYGDETQSWLIDRNFPPFHRAAWWLDLSGISVTTGETEQIRVTLQDGRQYTLRNSDTGYQLETGTDKAISIPDPDFADALTDSAPALRFLDVREKIIGPDPIGTQTLVYKDGRSLTLHVYRLNNTYWIEFGSEDSSVQPENTPGRWFSTDPISASELLQSASQW